jgi:hypothetical protein
VLHHDFKIVQFKDQFLDVRNLLCYPGNRVCTVIHEYKFLERRRFGEYPNRFLEGTGLFVGRKEEDDIFYGREDGAVWRADQVDKFGHIA